MDSSTVVIWVIGLLPVAVGVILLFFFRKQQASFKETLRALNAKSVEENTWSFPCNGKEVFLHYFSGSKYRASEVSLSVDGAFAVDLSARRENGFDRFCKTIGVNKELQVLDPEVDEKIYFEYGNETSVRWLMQSSGVRPALLEAFATFSRVQIAVNRCSFSKSPGNLYSFTPEQITAAAQNLTAFVSSLPESSDGAASATARPDSFESQKSFLSMAGPVLLFGSIFFSAWVTGIYNPVDPLKVLLVSLWISLPLLIVLVPVVCRQLVGHATSARLLFPTLFLGGTGVVFCIWGATVFFNGAWDKSAVTAYQVAVLDKNVSHSSKHGDSYYVTVSAATSRDRFKG
ncbi:MAG: hypothetical protein HQL18_03995 [Candidatus Omnitrophica bacterium]|nr:hypothetical protein [Candidatus Omnitrophota bacterium]